MNCCSKKIAILIKGHGPGGLLSYDVNFLVAKTCSFLQQQVIVTLWSTYYHTSQIVAVNNSYCCRIKLRRKTYDIATRINLVAIVRQFFATIF